MRFHSSINLVAFLPLILAQTPSDKGSHCRCVYGDPCWPSEKEFSTLVSSVSQPLIHPVPPASACYPVSDPSGNCTEVQTNWFDANWRADIPGAYENINFEAYTNKNGSISACFLNTTLGFPCDQGSVPPVGVDARTVEDIQAAVKFAAQHNLRLVVKNTGHDYLGRSAGRGAFMIWTHNLKNITYDASFVPEGGSRRDTVPAITLGAGVNWREAYAAVSQHQRFLLGGLSTGGASVGTSGGWIQGGGHSAFSAKFGLGVDNVVQFTIVTPSGQHIIANAHKHSDLFWALRGGGAGSWGVITSVTYKTHDLFPITMCGLNITIASPDIAQKVVTEFIKLHPKLSDAGWGGYSGFSNSSLMAFFVAPNVSWADTNATINPFFDFVRNATGQQDIITLSYPFEDFHTWFNATFGTNSASQVGTNTEMASRLLSRDAAEDERAEETARLLLTFDFPGINFVAGGAVSRVSPDSVALNPGWRKAVALAYTGGSWAPGASAEEIREVRQGVANDVRRLDPISPQSATYMNEASLYEPDFKKSFFGTHYGKLRDIKNKYDPMSLFVVAEGVGSDEWNRDLTCRT